MAETAVLLQDSWTVGLWLPCRPCRLHASVRLLMLGQYEACCCHCLQLVQSARLFQLADHDDGQAFLRCPYPSHAATKERQIRCNCDQFEGQLGLFASQRLPGEKCTPLMQTWSSCCVLVSALRFHSVQGISGHHAYPEHVSAKYSLFMDNVSLS